MVLHDRSGQKWALHFFHTTVDEVGRRPKRVAYCTLHLGDCAKAERPCDTPGAVVGAATCYFKDDFSRRTGRRVALTRAIAELNLPVETRRELWDLYLTKTSVPHGPRPE